MEQPYLQQVSVQAVYDFLMQHNNKLFLFISELMDVMLTSEDQSQPEANQLNSLAEARSEDILHYLQKQTNKTMRLVILFPKSWILPWDFPAWLAQFSRAAKVPGFKEVKSHFASIEPESGASMLSGCNLLFIMLGMSNWPSPKGVVKATFEYNQQLCRKKEGM
eukprot:1136751-Pelagomonas_calceolata.AAC.3